MPADVWQACKIAYRMGEDGRGLPPAAGGQLDQAAGFMQFLDQYHAERAWALDQARGRRL